jgi:hypothetical protein
MTAQKARLLQPPAQRQSAHGRFHRRIGAALRLDRQRLWPAMDRNAPRGLHGYGGVTVIDSSAKPLDDAPSSTAGGLFAGHMTDRE